MSEVTRILHAVEQGDASAANELLPVVYEELRKLAAARMANEAAGQTLQATALVHEAYMRLVGDESTPASWNSRGHFFAAAAESMRRILIDRARAKGAKKRGGDVARKPFDPGSLCLDSPPDELLDLDEALTDLAASHPSKAELVKLHIFAGLSLPEAATMLGMAPRTARDQFAYARAWLYRRLQAGQPAE